MRSTYYQEEKRSSNLASIELKDEFVFKQRRDDPDYSQDDS